MRIILGAPFHTHINDMVKVLGFMDIRSRISYVTSCLMYKVLHKMVPSYLINGFCAINDVHTINTRQSKAGDLYIPKCKTNYGKNTFQYKGCIIWNVLTHDIRNAKNL